MRRASRPVRHEKVAEELECGEINKGLWTMALTDALGDEDLAKPLYVKLRVARLKEE